jgi:hypothetical protein
MIVKDAKLAMGNENERREWSTPKIGLIAPVERTRGGGGDVDDQDDFWYVS